MRSPKALHTHALRLPPGAVIKMFLLASVSVIASVWAIVRFYTHPRLPMVVPATAVARDAGAGAGAGGEVWRGDAAEIPAPEVEEVP
jgi:hypothetical protein